MQVSCSACSAKYNIPDERVAGKRARMKCKKCAEAIIIDGRNLVLDSGEPKTKSTEPQVLSEAPPTRTSQPSFSEETKILGAQERTELAAESRRGDAYRDEAETSPVIKMGQPGKAPAADGLFNDGDVDAAMDSLSNVLGWSAPSESNDSEEIQKEGQDRPTSGLEAPSEEQLESSRAEEILGTSESSKGLEEEEDSSEKTSTTTLEVNDAKPSSMLSSEAFEDLEIDQTLKGLTIPTRTSSIPPSENYSAPETSVTGSPADSDTTRAPQPFESLSSAIGVNQHTPAPVDGAPSAQELMLSTQKPDTSFVKGSVEGEATRSEKTSLEATATELRSKKKGSPILLFLILMFVILSLAAAYIWLEGGRGSFEERALVVIEKARLLFDL